MHMMTREIIPGRKTEGNPGQENRGLDGVLYKL